MAEVVVLSSPNMFQILSNELKRHRLPPAHIHHVAYPMEDPPAEGPLARAEFRTVLAYFEISSADITEGPRAGLGVRKYPSGDVLLIVWRLHTEYYSYPTWHFSSGNGRRLAFGDIDLPGYQFPVCPMGARITWSDILIREEAPRPEELGKLFQGPELFASQVFEGAAEVYTDFQPTEKSHVRFLISSGNSPHFQEKVDLLVESVTFLENYSRLILLPMDEFNEYMDQVFNLEKEQVEKREEISSGLETAGPKQLKEWLVLLTRGLARINRIGDRVRYNLASAFPYDSILRVTLYELGEVPIKGHSTLVVSVNRSIRGIADGYQRLIERVDALHKSVEGAVAVLRARVEMAMEEQNLVLLQSVDQTTKNQVHLQQTVEGLSVIVLTYYITGISNYFFKSLEDWGFLSRPSLATGLFLPFSFLIAFGLVYRVKRALNHNNERKSKDKK